MQKHIFNKYDIRGMVGTELDLAHVEQLAHAIVSFYQKKQPNISSIAVGMDGRIHSMEIYQKVAHVVISRGLNVHFLGICPTPVFVFGLYNLPVQAGIMITGSHHIKEYNGFKLYLNKQSVWGDQIQEIYQLFVQANTATAITLGKIIPAPIIDQYVESIWADFSYLSQYDFSMIIDCGNGVVGPVLQKIIQKMKWKHVVCLHEAIDGQFPAHTPDPLEIDTMKDLQQAVRRTAGAFGIGFDGDASRMLAMEHTGSMVLGDRLLALFAQNILQDKKRAVIVYDVKSSKLVSEVIEQQGGIAIVSSTGAPLVKNMMDQYGAVLGGEMSGHYFFKDRHPGYDDGIYALCRLLELLVRERKSLHDLLDTLPKKYSSYEIRIPCSDQQKYEIVKSVHDAVLSHKNWHISSIDGMRAETEYGWGLLRACHSQSMVSFRCEAQSQQNLEKVKKEFQELLRPYVATKILENSFKDHA